MLIWWVLVLVPLVVGIELSSRAMSIHRELDDSPKRPPSIRDDFELKIPWRLFTKRSVNDSLELRRKHGLLLFWLAQLCLVVIAVII